MAKTKTEVVTQSVAASIREGNNGDMGKLAHLIAAVVAGQKPTNWDHENIEIERAGKKITLPAEPGPMPITDAIKSLERLKKDEEQETNVYEKIMAYPLEAAVAFVQAMELLYGWASPVPTPSFFGPQPPTFISVQTDIDEWKQVPWGSFKVPGVENNIQVAADTTDRGEPFFVIMGKVRKRERGVLLELARVTREILRDNSIYRGKALHIVTNGDDRLDIETPPTFIDTRKVNPDELIMNRDIQEQIDTNINAPVRFTEAVRKAKIPLKRCVLLEGRFGVGKTMTTRVTAKVCVDNGWTFITVDRPSSLTQALLFAQRYQPAVVFCEDIDRAMSERSDSANDLLNTIDGILTKDNEVMVILTTNYAEKIEPAMLRPGRIDSVISVLPPDAESVDRLIRLYGRGLISKHETIDKVCGELAGSIPASIREVVERSKLAMISQGRDQIVESDLLISARGMKAHLAMLNPKVIEISDEEQLGRSFAKIVQKASGEIDVSDLEIDDVASEDRLVQVHRLAQIIRDTLEKSGTTNTKLADVLQNIADRLDILRSEINKRKAA